MKKVYYLIVMFVLTSSCRKSITVMPLTDTDGKTGMLDAVNRLRQRGCKCGTDSMPPAPAVSWNDALAVAANVHAADMFYNNYFAHISPSGSIPIQRAKDAGYNGGSVLENIAQGYSTLSDVMDAWKKSPDHCKSIMDSTYKEMGAARADLYWVQEFGKN